MTRRFDVSVVGLYILDILGRPVTAIPDGGIVEFIDEIRLTVAGTAGGTVIDLAKLGLNCQARGTDSDPDAVAIVYVLPGRRSEQANPDVRRHGRAPITALANTGNDNQLGTGKGRINARGSDRCVCNSSSCVCCGCRDAQTLTAELQTLDMVRPQSRLAIANGDRFKQAIAVLGTAISGGN